MSDLGRAIVEETAKVVLWFVFLALIVGVTAAIYIPKVWSFAKPLIHAHTA